MEGNIPACDPWARVAELRETCARELARHAAAHERHRTLAAVAEAAHIEGRLIDLRPLAAALDEMLAATETHGVAWRELLALELQLLEVA